MNSVGVDEQLTGNECPASKSHLQFWRMFSLWVITYNLNLFLNLAPISIRITTEETDLCFFGVCWLLLHWPPLEGSRPCILGVTSLAQRWVCWFKASAEVNWLLRSDVGTWRCDFRPSKKWMLRYSFLHVNIIYFKDSSPGHHCAGDWELGWGISCLCFTVCKLSTGQSVPHTALDLWVQLDSSYWKITRYTVSLQLGNSQRLKTVHIHVY